GGQRFLALLSRSLAQQYEPAKEERAFQGYLKAEVPEERLAFKRPEVLVPSTELNPEIRRAIVRASEYIDHGPHVSVSTFLVKHTGLAESTVDDIILSTKSTQE